MNILTSPHIQPHEICHARANNHHIKLLRLSRHFNSGSDKRVLKQVVTGNPLGTGKAEARGLRLTGTNIFQYETADTVTAVVYIAFAKELSWRDSENFMY